MSPTTSTTRPSLLLASLLLLFLLCAWIQTVPLVNATTSECRQPQGSVSGARKGGVLSHDEIEDIVEGHVLSRALSEDSEHSLSEEDLDILSEHAETLSEEHHVLFRRFVRRLGRRIGRAFKRIGRFIGRVLKGLVRFLGRVFGFSKKAKKIIKDSLGDYNGATGPTKHKKENRLPFVGHMARASCIACRVNCMKSFNALGGPLFSSCKTQYYYYGCRQTAPCFEPTTAEDSVIEGMIGICMYRNGCQVVRQWSQVGLNPLVLQRVIGRIRQSQVSAE
ncbi:hypothetical protein C9374_002114 [Naegleria lovaniensis]|uniref:Uncharacterized protein n=1 Tax=Naegleria lovaniensis TaxID=51637 RepID=A0AA88GWL3_NAELO|nr:uncharacterized protein C9374_002114 [Naegleria lovaniensis]KAG2387079.1 hypothetical protein C9374_002114 [Naegleria lovaniensis]